MWNDEISLITKKVIRKDKLGQDVYEESALTILCCRRAITRSEFYQANQAGIRPSLVVDVHNFEYSNQEFAKYGGKEYRIIKTYPVTLDLLELTLVEMLL